MGSVLFVACKKEQLEENLIQEEEPEIVINVDFPMTTGSYWLYDWERLDSNNVIVDQGIDSVSITGDTIMNGKTFWVYEGTWYGTPRVWLLNQEGNKLISGEEEQILFSLESPGEVFHTYEEIVDGSQLYKQVSVCNGEEEVFETNFGGLVAFRIDHIFTTINEVYWAPEKINHFFYADNVGLLYEESFYYSGLGTMHREIKEYQKL